MLSTRGTSLGGDPLGARDRILNTKVAHRACAGRAPGKHSPIVLRLRQLVLVLVIVTVLRLELQLEPGVGAKAAGIDCRWKRLKA